MNSIVIALVVLFIWGFWTLYSRREELARELAAITSRIRKFLNKEEKNIRECENVFSDNNFGYFRNSDLIKWKNKYLYLFDEISLLEWNRLDPDHPYYRQIQNFLTVWKDANFNRNKFNDKFIEDEIRVCSDFFDRVEGRKLDVQQRRAVVTDEDNTMVVAAAGSGKTTTIVGKVLYLMKRLKIPAQQILLISFTKKSAVSLFQRLGIESMEVHTFHKFAKNVIEDSTKKKISLFNDRQYIPLITNIFTNLTKTTDYLSLLTPYFEKYLKPYKDRDEFHDQGEYIQYMKDHNFKTYKSTMIETVKGVTYNLEAVKSMEECKIANFLLFNGIEYQYETPYEYDTRTSEKRQYRPDFSIFHENKRIYLEHFAITANGQVPHWFSNAPGKTATQTYMEGVYWKRALHKDKKTILIETTSAQMKDGSWERVLTRHLNNLGVSLTPKSPEEIWKIISTVAPSEVKSFVNVICSFVNLMKGANLSFSDIKKKMGRSELMNTRSERFLGLVEPIFDLYEKHLAMMDEYDFCDLINEATDIFRSRKYSKKFSHILVDEFQDVSGGHVNLLNSLRGSSDANLFCVGDDWQSIYRFAGSDLTLFTNFEKNFGACALCRIEKTYRFNEPLIGLSSEFIQRNPLQIRKKLSGTGDFPSVVRFISSENRSNDSLALETIFKELVKDYVDISLKNIIILSRYNNDINRISLENSPFLIKDDVVKYQHIAATFMTVHKSKGLEADIVIVLNCNGGKYGFPSEISDDPVLNLVLSGNDDFEDSEERRTFYVAITRAKEQVYLISNQGQKSKFVRELEEIDTTSRDKDLPNLTKSQKLMCPKCKKVELVFRKRALTRDGYPYDMYGCLNYPLCDASHFIWY